MNTKDDPGSDRPRADPPTLLGYVGTVLVAGGFAILIGADEMVDPLAAAVALLVSGCGLLGVSLIGRRWIP